VKPAIFAVLALAALHAEAQNPPPSTLWYAAGHVELSVTNPAGGFTAAWQFDRADNGDIRIVKQEQRGASKVSGTLLSVCGDSALALKDIAPVRRHELQELDEPVLHLQLVLRLLARALPLGPLAVGTETGIDLGEQKIPIRVSKGSGVRRDFDAPWHVRGKVSRGAAGNVSYELVFSHADGGANDRRSELKLAGVWEQLSHARVLDNSLALADWQVYRVDTIATMVGGNARMDTVAVSRPLRFATLGELRTRIERMWDADPKARQQTECKL
jgi:hypothetical protein